MFSTALATMKFLSDTSPMIGFSSFLGTGGFFSASRWNFVAIEGETLNNSRLKMDATYKCSGF